MKDYGIAARLYKCWKAAGQLLEGWKYSSLNQGNPKSMKHKKTSEMRQNLRNKWIESLQTNLSVLYKITGTFTMSKQHFIKKCEHLVTF